MQIRNRHRPDHKSVSPARAAAFDILLRVEREDAYASDLLHADRVNKLSAADRGLTTELVMGVLRWRSKLDAAIGPSSSRRLQGLDPEVVTALRLAAYQLRFLDRVPARASINESVELVKRAKKRSAAPFANAVLRRLADTPDESSQLEGLSVGGLAHDHAHPEWLVERWAKQFGLEKAGLICQHDQQVPLTALRMETSEAEPEACEGIELAPGMLLTRARILEFGDITRTAAFHHGHIFIQDEGSQLVAMLVGTGSRILDCCAAPGGKTAAIAARNPTAAIFAAEVHTHRANLLRKRVRAANVQVVNADALNLPFAGGFDRVLADVPCSGTGTLARNPEIKWRLKPADLGGLHDKQVAIVRAALQQVAVGGRAIYSTCSLEREENEMVVEELLHANTQFTLLDCREELRRLREMGELAWTDPSSLSNGPFMRTIPGVHPCDGFFAAIIERRA